MFPYTKKRSLLHVASFLILFLPGRNIYNIQPGPALSSTNWQMVGQLGGPAQGIAVQGRHIYIGVGPRLIVLDAFDPASVQPVGGTGLFNDSVKDLAVSGTLAYVAAGSAGLRIVDISDPTHPEEVGAWDSPGYAEGVAISGQTVYLADGPYGLATINVSNPAEPAVLGSAYITSSAYDVAVNGRYAYIAAGEDGLLIADISAPVHPIETGRIDTAGYAYGIDTNDFYAYVADGWNGLQVVNITNPAHPVLGNLLATPGWVYGVTLSGTRAFVADAAGGLRLLDLSDPAIPLEIGAYETGVGHIGSVAIGDTGLAFLADRKNGVHVVNISNPADITQVSVYHTMSDAVRLEILGQYAYIAAGTSGLRIVDIADLTHPIEVGMYDTQSKAIGVQVSGTYAYVATMGGYPGDGMHVVDISDPAHPTQAGYFHTPYPDGAFRDIAVAGSIAFIPDEMGLILVDIADPAHPAGIGRIQLMTGAGQEAVGVAVSGDIAYVASSFAGLKTVDVSNPLIPFLLDQSTTQWSFAQDVVVVGEIAYVADWHNLRIINVSDPANLLDLGLVSTPGDAVGVAVEGETAYIADSGQGLATVDVSDLDNPMLTGGFDTLGFAFGIQVSGGYVYLADGKAGLAILGPTTTAFNSKQPVTASAAKLLESPNKLFPTLATRSGVESFHLPAIHNDGVVARPDLANTYCTVTSAADSGAGTLHACLEAIWNGGTIDFSPVVFPPTNPVTISLLTALPHLSGNVTLDASNAGVILDGSSFPSGNWALALTSDSNIVRGLQIVNFPDSAILVMGKNNIIGGDRSLGAGPVGQGNLISGNGSLGIFVAGPGASGNQILGNLVGTDLTGAQPRGNGSIGIFLHGGAHDNIVGGVEAWQRNIVSANLGNGISMMSAGAYTRNNRVVGNYVGTDITGTADLGNHGHGISMELAASSNLIQGNLSSGNGRAGVCISDQGSDYNIIIGNQIGTDDSGMHSIPNDWVGVYVGFGGSSFNRIGGTAPGEGNLISGNAMGLEISDPSAAGNLVLGNQIGLDASGLAGLGNVQGGIDISAGETYIIGNVIVANGGDGVRLSAGSTSSFVLGNRIGTDLHASIMMGNGGAGIIIANSGINFIQANVVAFNVSHGVQVSESQRNNVRRNNIFSNGGDGIALTGGGNALLEAPTLSIDAETGIFGTACEGCIVELFADEGGEGRYYLGSQVANGGGAFAFGRPCPLRGYSFTATATDTDGNTSKFSTPQPVLWTCCFIYLPLLLR